MPIALGRDGVLFKKVFGFVHPRLATPVYNVILTGLLACSALFLSLHAATSLINFGAFTAFAFVNLSVIFYFIKIKPVKKYTIGSILGHILVPFIGFLFNAFLWFKLDSSAMILGLGWSAAGFIYLNHLTKGFTKVPPEIDFRETEAS